MICNYRCPTLRFDCGMLRSPGTARDAFTQTLHALAVAEPYLALREQALDTVFAYLD